MKGRGNKFEATVKIVNELDYSSLEKINTKKVSDQLQKSYGPLTKKLFRDPIIGLSKEYAKAGLKLQDSLNVKKMASDLQKSYAKAAVQMSSAQADLSKNMSDASAKQRVAAAQEEMDRIENEIKTKTSAEEKLLDTRKKYLEEIDEDSRKSMSEVLKDKGLTAFNALSSIKSKVSDTEGSVIDSMSSTFADISSSMEEWGKKQETGGMKESATLLEQAAGKLGTAASAMSKGAGGVTALVVGLIALYMKASKQVKEMNKELMAGSSAIDFGVNNAQDLEQALKDLREASLNIGLATQFRASKEENMELIKSLNEQGLTYERITKGIDKARDRQAVYVDTLKQAHTYTQMLGLSFSEFAETQNTMIRDLHLTDKTAQSAFETLYRGAKDSGFQVRRFHSMVMQASSSLSLYNTRVEESASLLIHLGKIFGDTAGEILSQLSKGFVEEGMTDRIKRIMVTGNKNMTKIFNDVADRSIGHFARSFAGQAPVIQKALEGVGAKIDGNITLTDPAGQDKLMKTLAQLDPKQQAQFLSKLRDTGHGEEAKELTKMIKISQAQGGNLMKLAEGLGQLDFSGKLEANMKSAAGILQKPIHELQGLEIAAFESITGISGEQREMMFQISSSIHGSFDNIQKDLKSIQGKDENSQEYQDLAKYLEPFGAKLAKNSEGQTIAVDAFGKQIMDAYQLMSAKEKEFTKLMEKPLTEAETLARKQVEYTKDMMNTLNTIIAKLLEKIYFSVEAIVNFLGGLGLSSAEKKTKEDVIQSTLADMKSTKEVMASLQADLTKVTELAKDPITNPEDREELLALAADLESQLNSQQKIYEHLEEVNMSVKNLTTGAHDPLAAMAGGIAEKTGNPWIASAAQMFLGKEEDLNADDLVNKALRSDTKNRGVSFIDRNLNKAEDAVLGTTNFPSSVDERGESAKGIGESIGDFFNSAFGLNTDETIKNEKALSEEEKKQSKKQFKDAQTMMEEQLKEAERQTDLLARQTMGSLTGLDDLDPNIKKGLLDGLRSGSISPEVLAALTPEDKEILKRQGYLNDFLIQDGKVFAINSKDQVAVGAKPGGPLDQRGKGSSSPGVVHMNFYGADIATIKRMLKEAGVLS